MEHRKFGYIRVSSKDQNEGRQLEAMKKIGINGRDIYLDKQSGKSFERANYQLLKRVIRKGDILYIHSWIGSAGTKKKSSKNGMTSRKILKPILWYWICRYWIRRNIKTVWGLLLRI